jgi:hypothetical protein
VASGSHRAGLRCLRHLHRPCHGGERGNGRAMLPLATVKAVRTTSPPIFIEHRRRIFITTNCDESPSPASALR